MVGALGPACYLVLVTVLGMLWDGYDPIRDTQSELGAVPVRSDHLGGLHGRRPEGRLTDG